MNPILTAIQDSDQDKLIDLIKSGEDIYYRDEHGDSYLHYAVVESDPDILEILIIAGININVTNYMGETPLMYCVMDGDDVIFEILMKYKPDVNVQNTDGDTALFDAVYEDTLEMFYPMLETADLNIKNNMGKTVLDIAREFNRIYMISFIKSKSEQDNCVNNTVNRALFY